MLTIKRCENSLHQTVNMAEPEKVIRVGEHFGSFAELKIALTNFEKNVFANYVVQSSKVDRENVEIRYRMVRYVCKFSGEHTKTTNKRNTRTYKQGCESFIYVVQKKVNFVSHLVITAMNCGHNHRRNQGLFMHMTKQRQSAILEQKEHLSNVLAVKSNLKAVQKQVNVKTTHHGIITLKDLHNFKAKFKEQNHGNDLVQLVEQMIQIENATIRIIENEQNQLDCIFFQDSRMKMFFDSFPELVMFDGTYKLNNRRMPLVIMLVVDGNGESQIAGLCVVRSENAQTFRNFFEELKAENPRHTDIKVILSDKSFAIRKLRIVMLSKPRFLRHTINYAFSMCCRFLIVKSPHENVI